MHLDNLKYLELMALVGCTDEEIQSAFGCTLTPALLDPRSEGARGGSESDSQTDPTSRRT